MQNDIPHFEVNSKGQDIISWHNDIEIVFVLKGHGTLHGKKRQHEIRSEDVFIINSGDFHSIDLGSNGMTLSFLIPITYITKYAPELIYHAWDCQSFLYDHSSQQPFDKMRYMLKDIYKTNDAEGSTLLFRIRVLLLLEFIEKNFHTDLVPHKTISTELSSILQYITDHYHENIALSDVANLVHFTPSYTSRFFHREMQISFIQYVTNLRVSNGASLLRNTKYSVTEVAYMCGFSSTNAFIRAFKSIYKITPGKYQNESAKEIETITKSPTNINHSILSSLLKYDEIVFPYNAYISHSETHNVQISSVSEGVQVKPSWKKVINVAYAHDLLSARVQQQLKQVQLDIGFSMCRFLGITSDSMMLYHHDDNNNKITYYYGLIDEAIDFLLSIQLRPFIALGFMPEQLAKFSKRAYFSPVFVSMPQDLSAWEIMIRNLTNHFISRYGELEVHQWMFTIWPHPEVGEITCTYSRTEFLHFYRQTFNVIKALDPEIIITAPDCRIESWNFTKQFLEYSKKNNCLPDIMSFQYFGFEDPDLEKLSLIHHSMYTLNGVISNDNDHLSKQLSTMRTLLNEFNCADVPIIISSWNGTSNQRTCAMTPQQNLLFFIMTFGKHAGRQPVWLIGIF